MSNDTNFVYTDGPGHLISSGEWTAIDLDKPIVEAAKAWVDAKRALDRIGGNHTANGFVAFKAWAEATQALFNAVDERRRADGSDNG